MKNQEFSASFEYYKVFYYVAKYRSITAAAQKLFLTQPSVTKTIQRLEEQLDCQLFSRTKRGVALTAEGTALWQKVEPACQMLLAAEYELDAMKSLDKGSMTIASTEMGFRTYVLPAMKVFLRDHPNIKVRFVNSMNTETAAMLKSGQADLAVLHSPLQDDPALKLQVLDVLEERLVTGPRYRHLAQGVHTLEELSAYPMISMPLHSSGKEYMEQLFQDNGLRFEPEIELTTVALVIQAVESSLGISILSQRITQEKVSQGSLFPIQLSQELPLRYTYLVTCASRPLGLAARAFIEGYLLRQEPQSEA